MIQKLVRHGSGLAVVIDTPILEQLRIDAETELEVSSDGTTVTLRPLRDAERADRLRGLHDGLLQRYDKTFKRLAE